MVNDYFTPKLKNKARRSTLATAIQFQTEGPRQ